MNGLNRTIRQWKKKQQTKLWPATVSYCGLWSEDFHGFLFDNPYLDDGRVAKQFFWCLWKRKSFCHPDKLGWQHNYNQTCQIKFFPQLREVWGKFFIDPVTPSRVNNYKRLFFSGILIHDTKGWYGPFGSPKSYLILQLFVSQIRGVAADLMSGQKSQVTLKIPLVTLKTSLDAGRVSKILSRNSVVF